MAAVDAKFIEINCPEWTKYRKKYGFDPLVMQNSSVSLYQTLLPCIGDVTLRMRYQGLHAGLCRTYAQRTGSTSSAAPKRHTR